MKSSLYDRIGGEPALMAAVDGFYTKVIANEITRPYFEKLDMPAQIRKQIAFMTWAFGGPADYKGRDLRAAHANLVKNEHLGNAEFDAVAGCLEQTLVELGIERSLIDEVLVVVGSTRSEVLGHARP
jgi:hemoglobin